MINRGIYIIIIGIIFTGKFKVHGAFFRGLKLPFSPPPRLQFRCKHRAKKPVFAPLRPKGHICLSAEYFGVTTKRKNPFFAPLRPKGHICLSAEYFGVTTKRKNPFFAPLRPKGHICLSAEDL